MAQGEASAALWREVRDVRPFAGRAGAVWRVHLKPSDAPALLAALGSPPAILDWGGGLVWLLLPGAGDGGAAAVRGALAPLGGHATALRGAPAAAAPHPEAPAVAALSAGLRRAFDPRGLFAGAA
jgi:glycolate oxidase FAD binding subunit